MKNLILILLSQFAIGNIFCQTKQQLANYYFEQNSLPRTNIKQTDLLETLQKLDIDTSESWTVKSTKYWNLFVFSIGRFRKNEDLRTIWDANFKNDPYNTCEKFRDVLGLENSKFNYSRTAHLVYIHLLREYDYYNSVCQEYEKNRSPKIANQLSKIKKHYEPNIVNDKDQQKIRNENLVLLERIIEDLGKYPGRSIVEKELEDVGWLVIKYSSLDKMEKFLPILVNAIKTKDLHPKYGIFLTDKISLLK